MLLHPRLIAKDLSFREVAAETNYSNEVNHALLEAYSITHEKPVSAGTSPRLRGLR
jgi:hypothetical protein